MNTQKLTIEEAKQKLNNGFGSIYSREDVINLLDSIEMPQAQTPTANVDKILEVVKQSIRDHIYQFDTSDIVDYDSAEFEIEYGNKIELRNIDLELDNLRDGIVDSVFYDVRQMLEELEEEQEEEQASDESES